MARKKHKAKKKLAGKAENSGGYSFWRASGAILLIIAGIIVLFGAFIDAPIPQAMWNGVWWGFGAASIFVPFIMVYFGILKFKTEDHQIPLVKMVAVLGSLILLSSFLHASFLHPLGEGSEVLVGGRGGNIGQAVGGVFVGALGKFLGALLLFVFTAVALMFIFKIPPRKLLLVAKPFRRKSITGSEDLGELKAKMSGFKMNEGVPVIHHHAAEKASPKMSSFKNSAQKLSGDDDHAALTVANDPEWQYPPLNLLSDKQDKADAGDVQGNAELIKDTFANFSLDVEVEGANIGPRVTQYTIKPPTGVKLQKITALEDNLKLDLAAHSIRMEAPIPGKRVVGIEVPNVKAATVTLHGVFNSSEWREARSSLTFAVGKDIAGKPIIGELNDMPHLLIAGQTGSGKSVMINTLLTSLLYRNSPAEMKLILVDPKQVEMSLYNDIPHLLAPVVHEPEQCISALKWAVAEMERRLKTFAEVGRRNIHEYNKIKAEEGMPYIVVVIDELADLMMVAARDVESLIVRLAQKARAAGIHLVLATQRPSVDVITGLIKANVPARIAFTVVSQVDSRTIIDQAGAEKLLGKGDLLFNTASFIKPKRVQGALITDDETNKICDFLRMQRPPHYNDEVISQPVQLNGKGGVVAPMNGGDDEDDMWQDAVRVVIDNRKASTSLLQRKLRIGYGRASRLIDMMEEQGIISTADGAKPREVLVSSIDQVFGSDSDDAGSEGGDVYDDLDADS